MRRWLRVAGIGLAAACVALAGSLLAARLTLAAPRPGHAVTGPEAEALADRIAAAVDVEAWERTGAVRFAVFGHRYLWDRERGLVRYEDRRGVVLTEAWRPMGRAMRDGVEVGGEWKDRRVQQAYEAFVNDAFWAFAPMKLRDEGAVRALVASDQLYVRYASGGVTPGDAYLWTVGPDGLPTELRIWASVLPVPGLRVTWSGWTTLRTGVKVATRRSVGPFSFRITELDGAERLTELEPGPDPFGPMVR